MTTDLIENSSELTPQGLFLVAFDDAIKTTIRSLIDTGLDEECIWTALSSAIEVFKKSIAVVEREALREKCFSATDGRGFQAKSA